MRHLVAVERHGRVLVNIRKIGKRRANDMDVRGSCAWIKRVGAEKRVTAQHSGLVLLRSAGLPRIGRELRDIWVDNNRDVVTAIAIGSPYRA